MTPSSTLDRRTVLIAAALTVVLGLGLRVASQAGPAEYAGDLLYTVLIHWLAVLAAPGIRPVAAATIALAVSWAVEFLQLTGLPGALAESGLPVQLVLGTTFNGPDLFWYAVGAVVGGLAHLGLRRLRRGD